MIQGVTKIIAKMTVGDEIGVYRIDGDQHFLLFVFDQEPEAVDFGRALARLVRKPFEDRIADSVISNRLQSSGSLTVARRRS